MWPSEQLGIAIAVLLLCCVNLCAAAEATKHEDEKTKRNVVVGGEGDEVRSFHKEWKVQSGSGGKILKYGTPIANIDNSFLYAICSDEQLPKNMSCDVRLETPVEKSNRGLQKPHQEKCILELFADSEHEITGIVSLDRLGRNRERAIVTWWQRRDDSQYQIHKIGLSIISFTDCEIQHLYYPVDVEKRVLLSNVIVYPDGFDVIVTNEEICGREVATCRISHDSKGRRIGQPSPFATNFDTVHTLPVDSNSSSKGFYVYGTDVVSWKFRSLYVDPNGKTRHLMSAHGVSDPRQLLRATSNSNGLYGICVAGDRKFHCAQFDAEAKVTMSAVVNASIGVGQWAAIYNLAEGEALLATGRCNQNGNQKCRGFKVTRIGAGGKLVQRPINITDFHMKCNDVPGKFSVEIEESGKGVCFYFACVYEQQQAEGSSDGKSAKSSFKFVSKCVEKKYFYTNTSESE